MYVMAVDKIPVFICRGNELEILHLSVCIRD